MAAIEITEDSKNAVVIVVALVLVLIAFYISTLYNYLLFHTAAEMFAVVIACSIFVVTWNSRRFFQDSQFFPFIGIAYLFVGILDLTHTLTYKGVNIFPGFDANVPTQLWVSARYLESSTLLASFFVFRKQIKAVSYFWGFSVLTILILLSIFYWQIFPDCYLEAAGGLTPFKIISEYVICLLLAAAVGALYYNRYRFDRTVFNWLLASILTTIIAELSFTNYIGIYSTANLVGHYFKIISFYCLYKALIEIGLSRPYSMLFKDLTDSNERYQALFSNMINGFARHRIVLDEAGKPIDYQFLEVNPAFENLTGLKEVQGKRVTQLLPDFKEDPIDWIDIYGKVALGGESIRLENYAAPLGKWYSVIAYSARYGEFVTIFEDITERKQASDALSRQREWLDTTLNSIGDGVISADENGRVSFINPVAEKLTGWQQAEAMGRKIEEIFRIYWEREDKPSKEMMEIPLSDGQPPFLSGKGMLLRRDETRIPVEQTISPIKREGGNITGLVVIFRDITIRRQFQKELKEANESLEEKVRDRTWALHQTIEHLKKEIELRVDADIRYLDAHQELVVRANQLRALAGRLTMAEQAERRRVAKILHDGIQQYMAAAKLHLSGLGRQIEDPKLSEVARKIEETIGTCIQMARSLSVDLSPPALYRGGLVSGLRWLADWMQERYQFYVDFKSEKEKVSLPEDIVLLVFESARELLFNAVKHAGTSRAQVRLKIVAAEDKEQLCLCIEDEGNGFEPSEISVSGNMQRGFGLFSIQERIHLIGGSFEIKSRPGSGSAFTITLSYEETSQVSTAGSDELHALKFRNNVTVSEQPVKDIRVMLADDHAIFRKGVFQALKESPGIEVVGQAHDGLEIVELAEKLNPDVILMDINMPGISGIEATRRIYQAHPKIKILALSMHEKKDYAREMISAGAVDFISKGCTVTEMVTAIQNAMRF